MTQSSRGPRPELEAPPEYRPAAPPREPITLRMVMRRYVREASFRRHLSVAVALGAVCMALLMAVVSAWQGGRQVRAMLMEQGERVAANLASSSSLALLYASADNAEEAVGASLAFPDVLAIEIRDHTGRVLLALGPARGRLPERSAGAPRTSDAGPWLDLETDESWTYAAPVWSKPDTSPFDATERPARLLGHVRVMQSKATLDRAQASLFLSNLTAALAFTALFLVGVRYLALRLTRPLQALSDSMERVERGDADVRAPAGGPRDIAAMAHAFNRMLEALREREAELAGHRDHLEELVQARTEALSAAMERAEDANRAKSQFLARMSHELRTPLNAILGYAQILKMSEGLNLKQTAGLETIQSSGQHLLTLIVDILDLSRIEAGKVELFLGPVELAARVRSAVDIVGLMAAEKGIELRLDLADDLPSHIQADEKRLSQVLINLLGNAVKFTHFGGVTLAVRSMPRPDGAAGQVLLRFDVRDTGVGIAEDQIEQLFEPFEQAGDAKQRLGGTGLGLTISRQLVRLMGGEITVESRLGVGSVFWFEIEVPVLPPAD
ncbi:ATP-binding protein [Roseateles sp.]|uniref:ATP-binding protein n=1 Tax=Roseateles sp. TaxID=1971397 RepID=UPI00394ABD83